ncbi:2-C-methyl-D-erythritol 4-phosphate cytidylyltransferase [Trueperella pecoris]|uniref:2-C-methyl-D-erythritol 4-phosphate cytidylyltransferase n=1 Tax=Trueperella pecoris TaxID=2733571 RepID=A0A7M1R041_9ACTO|nr:IspD/TarI family cytidylyltransferase [Trueperella pecoris]QOR47548.1 2-C-methyl-D-erythritol 4-phosphate cytidylyltransferase [Trueperella pecoris]
MSFAAVIAGAGSGTRLGANMPKALVRLGGVPLLVHAIRGMNAAGIDDVVVTIPAGVEARAAFTDALAEGGVAARLVVGGSTRQGSVANGLAAVTSDYVLIHDAARALTPVSVISRVCRALEAGHDAVVPALAVTDTIKEVGPRQVRAAGSGGGSDGRADAGGVSGADGVVDVEPVVATLDRAKLRAMQTPQGFRTELVRRAHRAGWERGANEASAAPDDAALVEAMGEPVVLVEGSPEAMKVTTAWDLAVAHMLLTRGE